MVKIAVELEQALAHRAVHGSPGEARPRVLAQGDGWTVTDVVCTSGPQDRPFEEQHSNYTIALVTAGTFQYRAAGGCELMSPGSLVLGNAGQYFECGHEHGAGDRCLAFWYTRSYFERLAADVGLRKVGFPALRLPPLRELSSITARARAMQIKVAHLESGPHAGKQHDGKALPTTRAFIGAAWEEISAELAARVVRLALPRTPQENAETPSAIARITRTLRLIERQPETRLTLEPLAQLAGLSPCHFLRVFAHLTGLTPHQYILRARLREAGFRLAVESAKILDIALDCGFGDVSNFNHAFHAEFGLSPRMFRAGHLTGHSPGEAR